MLGVALNPNPEISLTVKPPKSCRRENAMPTKVGGREDSRKPMTPEAAPHWLKKKKKN
jgi:hypothetical protein